MTIVKALKKLITAWGGSTTAETIADAIDDLSAVTPSSLPEVSSTDNGDILKVVSGEWAKGDPELPAVTGSDNGRLLGVSEGAWAVVNAPSGGAFLETLVTTEAQAGDKTWSTAGTGAHTLEYEWTPYTDIIDEKFGAMIVDGFTVSLGDHTLTFPKALVLEAAENGVTSSTDVAVYYTIAPDSEQTPTKLCLTFNALESESWAQGTVHCVLPSIDIKVPTEDFVMAVTASQNS